MYFYKNKIMFVTFLFPIDAQKIMLYALCKRLHTVSIVFVRIFIILMKGAYHERIY